jgi:nucleotide-binding universal stress UspA family protein
MYNTIVVGTDGSATASIAVARATELAKLTGATLHVVHAYQPLSTTHAGVSAVSGGPTIDVTEVNAGIAASAENVCGQAAELAESQAVTVEAHAWPGEASDALIAAAKDLHADLIVVGSRGMSGVRRFVLGSVPNKVSHHCPCSLLIVDTAAAAS